MNTPAHIDVDDTMLAKYVSGEASAEEACAVDQWINASQDNRVLLEQAMSVWARIPESTSWRLPDNQKALKDLREELSRPSSMAVKRFPWMVAAALAMLAAATGLWIVKSARTPERTFALITRSAGSDTVSYALPDHSVVGLGHHATIRYPAQFPGPSREVFLRGEASFAVAPDPGKPFIINVGDVKIEVLGTSFEIRPDTDAISVEVLSGIVRMFRGDKGVTISASHTGIYHKKTKRFSLAGNLQTVVRSFNFRNATLKQIAGELEEAYGIQVIFENKRLENRTMSSSFDDKPLQFVLKVISITLNMDYRIDENTVYLGGERRN